ncbi:RnfABCDGE type electron transport complex subunit D [Magnetospirillum sp. UT-4]|uniref:RnfABCDGE type electron transport complex subunit D n=1 Tax=Magnetospirillum sp. UT-4 TaxID=2681467 RepID=UPI00137FBE19|nr:RnfABCDGE type electron transport complex subunit D [Magnetospirillum sp. UT-4]CAA7626404.1 putative inner membrane oxidoreductase [Magnetospirillum sp. UT-4]
MSSILIDKSAPFTHAPTSVSRTMVTVLAALVPATAFDLWLFGWPALFLFLVTIAACVAFEAASLALGGRTLRPALTDGSAVLTGWLLAMTLPPWAPWWIGVLGALFAIPLAKHAFGGLGQNVFNPAMVGRVALLVSFPVQMTLFVAPQPLFSAGAPGFVDALGITFGSGALDTMSAASALGHLKTELSRGIPVNETLQHMPGLMDTVLGIRVGSMGETSAVLVLAGGLFLLARGVISWHIPVTVLGTIFALGTVFNLVDPGRFAPGSFHLLSGATMLGAFFIATDYVTSPVSRQGQLVYGFGIGLMTWVIRTFAGYPEGMAFAVLLLNAMTPIIDSHFRPRTFGRTRKGDPLPLKREP